MPTLIELLRAQIQADLQALVPGSSFAISSYPLLALPAPRPRVPLPLRRQDRCFFRRFFWRSPGR